MICRLLAGILERQNFVNIRVVGDGRAAIELLQDYQPDLLLLDMQMPDMSGLDVCKMVRSQDAFVDVPILIQTATVDRKEMGNLFAAGASDFLSKPINPAELVSRVLLHLERRNLVVEMRGYRERISRELESARRMQAELVPSPVTQRNIARSFGVRFGAYSRSSSEIGGDIWGILPIDGASMGIFLADFTGHGVTAALNTFRLHALIHEYRALHDDPQELVKILNTRLARLLPRGQFATFLYIVIDLAAGEMKFASAGAPPIILKAGEDEPAILTVANGIPLGIVEGAQYECHRLAFPDGASLLLFSDGLSENPDAAGERLGEDGLREALDRFDPNLAPAEVIGELCAAAGISEDLPLPDDTTVLCIDRKSEDGADQVSVEPAELLSRVLDDLESTP